MRIGFIGAGHVASAFGRYLHIKGITVSGYFDRHRSKTIRAAAASQAAAFDDAGQVAAASDMVLITTRDDQIESACIELCKSANVTPDHFIGHMSGAGSIAILQAASNIGAAVFSLHPLQAFADPDKAVEQLGDTFFSLEGDDPRLEEVKKLMARLGNPLFLITSEQKALYHLAACIMSNYLVTLMDLGLEALNLVGIDSGKGFQAMYPLITGTLENVSNQGTASALTGPIARADVSTIRSHLAALEQAASGSSLEKLYRLLAQRTLPLAAQAHPELEKRLQKLAALLANEKTSTTANLPEKGKI